MDYTRAMFGENAVHVPFNFVRQLAGDNNGLILGQETGNKLSFGSTMAHVLVKGDMIFRPHIVIESDMLIGMGAAGIITSSAFGNITEWDIPENKVILDIRR